MAVRTFDIVWLAGILEGEGSFFYKESDTPFISIQMCDEDIVRRVAAILGGKVSGPYDYGHQLTWACRLHSKRSIAWMMTLYPLMGLRRQAKIRDIIHRWKTYVAPMRPNALPGKAKVLVRTTPTCGHPKKRVVTADGLCRACYMRQWRKDRMAAAAEQGLA